jgi:hypothetical protein
MLWHVALQDVDERGFRFLGRGPASFFFVAVRPVAAQSAKLFFLAQLSFGTRILPESLQSCHQLGPCGYGEMTPS